MYFKSIYFYEVLNEYVDYKKNKIKSSSYYKYKYIIDNYIIIISYFYDTKIKNINNSDIVLFFNNSDIKKLDFKNEKKVINYLTLTGQNILEKYIKDNINIRNLLVLTTLYSGVRIGEICALKWNDIDFINCTISINKTVQRINCNDDKVKTKLIIDISKTKSSIRIIPIPKFVIILLNQYKSNTNNFVFTNSNKPKDPRSVEKYFNSLLSKLNIRHLKFHSLRHTFATRLREQKVNIKVISELLGHSNWKITQDIYVHSSFDIKKKSVNELCKFWNKI